MVRLRRTQESVVKSMKSLGWSAFFSRTSPFCLSIPFFFKCLDLLFFGGLCFTGPEGAGFGFATDFRSLSPNDIGRVAVAVAANGFVAQPEGSREVLCSSVSESPSGLSVPLSVDEDEREFAIDLVLSSKVLGLPAENFVPVTTLVGL